MRYEIIDIIYENIRYKIWYMKYEKNIWYYDILYMRIGDMRSENISYEI